MDGTIFYTYLLIAIVVVLNIFCLKVTDMLISWIFATVCRTQKNIVHRKTSLNITVIGMRMFIVCFYDEWECLVNKHEHYFGELMVITRLFILPGEAKIMVHSLISIGKGQSLHCGYFYTIPVKPNQ